jgi:hypothetical protein
MRLHPPRIAVLVILACGFAGTVVAAAAGPTAEWSRLSHIAPGTEIVVGLRDGRTLTRRMVRAEEEALVVVNVGFATSKELGRQVLDLLSTHPDVFTGPPHQTLGDVRVDNGMVSQPGRPAVSLALVVQRLERGNIRLVAHHRRRGSLLGDVLVFSAALAGIAMGHGPVDQPDFTCPGDCLGRTAPRFSVGIPSSADVLAAFGVTGMEVLYVAPATVFDPGDAVDWHTIRLALPPSLRGKK